MYMLKCVGECVLCVYDHSSIQMAPILHDEGDGL